MAKKNVKKKKPQMTIPIAIVAGFVPGAMSLYEARSSPETFGRQASRIYTGFDPVGGKYNLQDMRFGTFPIFGGFLVHKVASALGVNRALGAAKMPFLRI